MSDRASYLVLADFDRLEDWCRMVRAVFDSCPYLVGSATERKDYRDVDIRIILADETFDAIYKDNPLKVLFTNRAISSWGQRETGLPVDFQVQRQTEANAQFSKSRNAMGIRDWNTTTTSGAPCCKSTPYVVTETLTAANQRIAEQQAEIERLREALEFYACDANYDSYTRYSLETGEYVGEKIEAVCKDGGSRATKALADAATPKPIHPVFHAGR